MRCHAVSASMPLQFQVMRGTIGGQPEDQPYIRIISEFMSQFAVHWYVALWAKVGCICVEPLNPGFEHGGSLGYLQPCKPHGLISILI